MRSLFKVVLVALFTMVSLSSVVSADIKKGQKIIIKKLKKPCSFDGGVLAKKHTQAEWKVIYDGDKFQDELKIICPNLKKPLKEKYTKHVYDFLHHYASDSNNVPS